jgi:hypothetical protein
MLPVHLKFLFRKQGRPEHRLWNQRVVGPPKDPGCLKRAAIRIVSFKVRRIDLDFFDDAEMPERDNTPVIPRFAPPSCFPAITHVNTAAWHQHIRRRAEMLIVSRNHVTSIFHGGQIVKDAPIAGVPVAQRLPVNPQASEPAIMLDVQADMRTRLVSADREVVMRIALEVSRG